MSDTMNDHLVFITGSSASGKSVSLRNIRNQKKWLYLNTESNKRLPFKNSFRSFNITEPFQVYEAFDYAAENPEEVEGIIIDTLTFLMDMFESQYIINTANTQKAWGDYAQFFKVLMQSKVALAKVPVIIMAHTRSDIDEQQGIYLTSIPIKGSLKNNGIEAYSSVVVSTKKIPLKELKEYGSDLLEITPEEKELGFKYVFQTRLTAKTTGERIRGPMNMFTREQTYIDNCAQSLLDHLKQFYAE